jgi:hypothetical protein
MTKPSLPPGTKSAKPGPRANAMTATEFAADLERRLNIRDRQVRVKVDTSWGPRKEESVYVDFANLPKGIGSAGGGAEAENNRASFWVRGFGPASASEAAKVKAEQSNSSLYKGAGAPSRETRVTMRAKTGTPEQVAKSLADFLNGVVKDVEPRFTHSNPDGSSKYRV